MFSQLKLKASEKRLKWVGGSGPPHSTICIVGEAPGTEEEKQGVPFVGGAGWLLESCLTQAGISKSHCYVTNVVKVRPPKNDLKLLPELGFHVADFHPSLVEEIKGVKPNVVLALGGYALQALTSYKSIMQMRGSILESSVIPGMKIIPAIHPAAILRNYKWKPLLALDLKRLREECESPEIKLPERILTIEPTLSYLRLYIDTFLKSAEKISFDIEVGLDKLISCIAFSHQPDMAICIPFRKGYSNYWTEGEELLVWKWIEELFQGEHKWIAQNALFDMKWLVPKVGYFPIWMDTMWAHQLCLYNDVKVVTRFGAKKIAHLVRNKSDEEVLSFNEKTNQLEWKKIIGWHRNIIYNKRWIQIKTSDSRRETAQIICTPEHKLLTKEGWIEASNILLGDKIVYPELDISKMLGQIVGTLLGDATIQDRGDLGVLSCAHKIEELTNEKKAFLSQILVDASRQDSRGLYPLVTKCMFQLKWLRSIIYPNGVKVANEQILSLLNPQGLAWWYMDDGYIEGKEACAFATQGFDSISREYIRSYFEKYFGKTESRSNGAIGLSREASKEFCRLVGEFIIPEIRYKIPESCKCLDYYKHDIPKLNSPIYVPVTEINYDYMPAEGKRRYNVKWCIDVEDNHNFFTPWGLVHNCYAEIPKGLDTLASIYTREPYYKDERKVWKDRSITKQLYTYNARDAAVTIEVALKLEEELECLRMREFFFQYVMKLNPLLLKLEMRGLLVDLNERSKVREQLELRKRELEQSLGGINVRSSKQMQQLLFEEMGMKKMYHHKTGKVSTGKEALIKLRSKL